MILLANGYITLFNHEAQVSVAVNKGKEEGGDWDKQILFWICNTVKTVDIKWLHLSAVINMMLSQLSTEDSIFIKAIVI